MKVFVIFPAICLFALVFTILRIGLIRPWTALLWSTLLTAIFGGLMAFYSVQVFYFLYYANFIGCFILIPCLTYLMNKSFKNNSSHLKWVKIIGLGLVSSVLTIAVAGFLFFISLLYNPMDPPIIISGGTAGNVVDITDLYSIY